MSRRYGRALLTSYARTASPIASSSASTLFSAAAFSTSAAVSETRARRKSRLIRKGNLEAKAQLARAFVGLKPDAVTGTSRATAGLWDQSTLKRVLLKRKDIWGETVRPEVAIAAAEESEARSSTAEEYVPTHFNFGLDADSAASLLSVLPGIAALRTVQTGPQVYDEAKFAKAAEAAAEEKEKRDKLARIIDLKNADSKGIRVENTRRIVAAFQVTGDADTGSPEVQGRFSFLFLARRR